MNKEFLVKAISILAFTILLFSGCTNDIEIPTPENERLISEVSVHNIPIIKALNALDEFVNDGKATRSNSKRIKNILTLNYKSAMTRGNAMNSVNCENLVYVANFENNEGYAILAADDRIGDDIIAVTESGNINSNTLYRAASHNDEEEEDSEERPFYDSFPTSGPGFYYSDDNSEELFMNPNTVNLNIVSENDTLVGNFDNTINSNDTRSKANSINDNTPIHIMALNLCLSYAEAKIISYKQDCEGDNRLYKSNRGDDDAGVIIGNVERAPAGCFPLSVAKLFVYHNTPALFNYCSDSFTIAGFKKPMREWNATQLNQIGVLLKGISDYCKAWYFYYGTFCFPKKVQKYLKNSGYMKVDRSKYNENKIISMLDKKNPVLIYAMHNLNLGKSHAWLLYGYKLKSRSAWRGSGEQKVNWTEQKYWVHCDFRWRGVSNGFYLSNVFNSENKNVEFDNAYKNKINYNKHIRIMTYELATK